MFKQMQKLLREGGSVPDLLRRATRSHITWDDFLTSRLPSQMSPLEAWELMHLLSHAVGIDLPVPDLDENRYWYTRTHELTSAVCTLQCRCRADSSLYRELTTVKNRSVLVRSRIDETIATALLDGLDITEEEGRALLQLDYRPRTPPERATVNTLRAMDNVERFIDRPFTRELMFELREMLLEGVDVSAWHTATSRMGLIPSEYSEEAVRRCAEQQLAYICDYANHASGDSDDHPVLRALLLPDLFRFYRPLPDMNSQVGRLVFRLYALKAGLPVLGLLPLSRAKLSWEEGTLASSVPVPAPTDYFEGHRHFGGDLTGYMTLAAKLALAAFEGLERQIRTLAERDDGLRDLLQSDADLNHRQRSVLGRALRNPDAEFRIAYHKTTHNVVYATARADLLELVDRGYLRMEKRGRAFVFVAEPDLRTRIEQRGMPAGSTS
jgi:Fic family protein